MGGPSYQTPYPVKRSDGSEVIWDWGSKSWGPYDRKQVDANKAKAAADMYGRGDPARGEGGDTSAAPGAEPTGAAPGGPTGEPTGPSFGQQLRKPTPRRSGGTSPYTSLLGGREREPLR